MRRLMLLTSLFALPSVAAAHAGHAHTGDPVVHHLAEAVMYAAPFAVAAALIVLAVRFRKSLSSTS